MNRCFIILALLWMPSQLTGQEVADLPWAFRSPQSPAVPMGDQIKHPELVLNSIDAFIQARLDSMNLARAPKAEKHTLVRRAYFDLIGLPPSPEQIEAFVNDESGNAWINLINNLLESPQYGERWGRHWLDVARYADSQGFEGDNSIPNAWRYRDYVIKSFNDDKPYDQFVQEQIAADEIWPDNLDLDPKRVYILAESKRRNMEARVGTGFFALSPQVAESALDAHRLKHETLTDWVDTTTSVFMGLTVGCARCHEHKFDPISQEDYYAMQAIFAPSTKEYLHLHTPMMRGDWHWLYPRLTAVEEAKIALKVFRSRTGGRELNDDEKQQREQLRNTLIESVIRLPDNANSVPNEPFDILMTSPTATVLGHDHPKLLKPVHFLDRGELGHKEHVVKAAIPVSLANSTDRDPAITKPFESRKEFALWLTQSDNPLTARVMMNRIWQWHFGRGIISTPNDFGEMGAAPTHPELLDWLALSFIEHNWSIKEMHRLIMTSYAYQASSQFGTDEHEQVDPDNKYFWRMNRRRLEAEALWDSVHATAGTINLKMYGRPVVPPLAPDEIAALREKWQWPISGDPAEHTRRGVYIMVRRNFRFPMFEVFDAPITSVSCPQRDVTTVAPQALWTLNSPSVYRQAKHLANRLVQASPNDPNVWVKTLWKITLARTITDQERAEAIDLLNALESDAAENLEQTKANIGQLETELATLTPQRAAGLIHLCLTVYNLNEFSFVD